MKLRAEGSDKTDAVATNLYLRSVQHSLALLLSMAKVQQRRHDELLQRVDHAPAKEEDVGGRL